jgi:NADPH:quinone reductase-like Zn-dependent oxidoreductase
VPVPRPKEEEVLIKVEAACLNPIDWRIQEGILRPILPPKLLSVLPLPNLLLIASSLSYQVLFK